MTARAKHVQTCQNPKCERGERGRRKRFKSNNPALYCSDACRLQARYERKRAEKLRELGLR